MADVFHPDARDVEVMRRNVQAAQFRGAIDYAAGERLIAVLDSFTDAGKRAAALAKTADEIDDLADRLEDGGGAASYVKELRDVRDRLTSLSTGEVSRG